jgi:hypothetical protein
MQDSGGGHRESQCAHHPGERGHRFQDDQFRTHVYEQCASMGERTAGGLGRQPPVTRQARGAASHTDAGSATPARTWTHRTRPGTRPAGVLRADLVFLDAVAPSARVLPRRGACSTGV